MDKIFRKIINNNLSDLQGMIVDASIPVPEALINEIIEAALQGDRNIQACSVSIHQQNRINVNLKTTLLPWSLYLKLKLDRSVDFASYSSPKIRAWLENNILLGRVGSFFNVLPAWVKLYGEQVVLDLGAFLKTTEQKRMLELVKSVGIRTEEGKVILDVKISVDK
jgi:hypothetical protein